MDVGGCRDAVVVDGGGRGCFVWFLEAWITITIRHKIAGSGI